MLNFEHLIFFNRKKADCIQGYKLKILMFKLPDHVDPWSKLGELRLLKGSCSLLIDSEREGFRFLGFPKKIPLSRVN